MRERTRQEREKKRAKNKEKEREEKGKGERPKARENGGEGERAKNRKRELSFASSHCLTPFLFPFSLGLSSLHLPIYLELSLPNSLFLRIPLSNPFFRLLLLTSACLHRS